MEIGEEALQPVYKELNDLIGTDSMLKIFNYYCGSQITFPVHLYSRVAVKNQIIKNYNGKNKAELVRRYGYSQRWVTKILNSQDNL